MTVKQAAERLGVSQSLVYMLCEGRQLAHRRIGAKGKRGKIIILEEDIAAFLESIKVEARHTPEGPTMAMPRLKHLRLPGDKRR